MTAEVTFVWSSAGGARTGICKMPWSGHSLHTYLRKMPLRQHGLLGLWKHCRTVNAKRQKVKLHYTPPPGDVIVLRRVKPLS